MPMERAEPARVLIAASMFAAFMSFSLVLAISSSWARVILPTLSVWGDLGALVQLDGLLDQDGRGRRLDDEGEALVREGGDHHRQRQARLDALGLGVERLAELHDVQAALAQRGTDRGRRVRLAGRDLQLHEADNLLCHVYLPCGYERLCLGSPGLQLVGDQLRAELKAKTRQVFSTCENSSSTGVARPKMVTDTRTLLFS
jgi:hypothetical protein